MSKFQKKKLTRDPKEVLRYIMEHDMKRPQSQMTEVLKSIDINSDRAKANETSMIDKNGNEIIYIILENQEKDKVSRK